MGVKTGPERAQELLEGAEPGPWRVICKYPDGEPRSDTSSLIHTHDGKYLGIMHGQCATLAAAAPDLAETIAGMHYEYAVQVQAELDGMWHMMTRWQDDPRPIQPEGRDLEANERIVRRLVTDMEVIE